MKSKRPFTLIEISIALFLLGVLASIVGWQVYKLLDAHRLRSSAQNLVSEFKKLQALALTYQTEMELKIYTDKQGGLSYQIRTDEPKMIGRNKRASLLGVKSIGFISKGEKREKLAKIDYTIYSSGRIDPANRLILLGKQNEACIDFTSTPQVALKIKELP